MKFTIFIFIALFFFSYSQETIILITIPKTGTHLLSRCIELLTGKEEIKYSNSFNVNYNFFYYHLPFSHENSNSLKEYSKDKKIFKFFTLRDPRDEIISFIHWGLKHNTKSNWKCYSGLGFDELLICLICFGELWYSWKGDVSCSGIKNYYKSYLDWLDDKDHIFCLVRFENLVGIKGGGSEEMQYKEIKKIIEFLKIEASEAKIKKVAKELFGQSYTYREGQIGSWKKYFKDIHKAVFKKLAGQLLIDLKYEKDLNW